MADSFGVWVYAVTFRADWNRLGSVTGVGEEPLRSIAAGGLEAVVGSVDLAEFGEEPLRRRLEDVVSLDRIARGHHRVVEAVASGGTTVPSGLATIYRDDSRVADMLVQRRDDLMAALRRLRGRTEWGVKAFVSPQAVAEVDDEDAAAAGHRGPGTSYLLRRRAQLSAGDQVRRVTLRSADEAHAALADLAAADRRHRTDDPYVADKVGALVLNGAYLVDDERTVEFSDLLNELAGKHKALRFELTGPWPAYSFAGVGGGASR